MSEARDFDGVDDQLDLGSDASIDQFVSHTMSFWVIKDVSDLTMYALSKNATGLGWTIALLNTASSHRIRYRHIWTGTGTWIGTTAITAGQIRHIAVVYNGAATANDATIYVDGVAETLTTDTNPTGTITDDSTGLLLAGLAFDGTADLDGALQNLCYSNSLWIASQVNRARWYGSPGGAQAVYHPLLTTKLTNEGTATANGTATGTTMRSLPRTERMYCGMTGVGR